MPTVRIQDLDFWDPVLEASLALQMTGIQTFILGKFEEKKYQVEPVAMRLLIWVVRCEVAFRGLKMNCIRALVYRCQPISSIEGTALGTKLATQIMHIRERVRTTLLSNPESIQEQIRTNLRLNATSGCPKHIYQALVKNLSVDSTKQSAHGQANIFQLDADSMCGGCRKFSHRIARWFDSPFGILSDEIVQWSKALGLEM